jgi:transcriptional regulator GlxA family with amidase domain
MMEGRVPPPRVQTAERAMATGRVTWTLLSAFQRLVELLDEPEAIPAVAPLVQREILYRLLVGDQSDRLRQIGTVGSQSHQIGRAIEWLKAHFAKPLRIDELAGHVRMSASTFHHHFRALTAMSPLQYQKWLRLTEARRLMLAERLDASTAAFRVGYESVSQFSREYSRQFGAPPMRDIAALRQEAG